ncbi:MAG: V-type ATPase subunit [Myxococcota bacterium]
MSDFTAAGARARGLSTHLFHRSELEQLVGSDTPSLARSLSRSGRLAAPLPDGARPRDIDHAVRQTVKRHLALLARWDGSRPVIEVFSAEQDRRSLRTLLRGAQQSASSDRRLAGLAPTSTLPERVLAELAHQPTPAEVVAHLVAIDHPDAGRLAALTAKQAQPDLFAIDLALVQGFAERGLKAVRRGDDTLHRFVSRRLDLLNAQTALLLGNTRDVEAERCFVPGGLHLPKERFLEAARGPAASALLVLRRAFHGTPLEPVVEGIPDANTFEYRGLAVLADEVRREAREAPLGSGPLLDFLLHLDAMANDLRRLAWASALGAPVSLVRPELVTP